MRYERGYVDFTRPPPPVKEGDVLTVKIEGVGSSGDGLARVKGFVIFVPGTKMEEEVKVRVTKVSRKVGFAERVGDDEVVDDEVVDDEVVDDKVAEEGEDVGEDPGEAESEPEEEKTD